MVINNQTLRNFREDFKKAVSGLENAYGVEITPGNIRFDENSFSIKVDVENRKTAAEKDALEREMFSNYVLARPYTGLTPDMFGKTFKGNDGNMYTITGIKPGAPKNFLKVIADNGKEYVCPPGFLTLKD